MPPIGFRYHAFISFAPGDNREPGRKWADWLKQTLEGFRVPAALAGRRTPLGQVPASLSPVYTGGCDLTASGELSPETREALEQSRVLVVVCSPQSAQSALVAEEVRVFKQIGRGRVMAFVVAGDPDKEDSRSCFAEPLRHDVKKDGTLDRDWRVHPVSADARNPDGSEGTTDGRDPAFARLLDSARQRILAGVLGVPAPELARVPASTETVATGEVTISRGRGIGFGGVVGLLGLALAGGAGWFAWQAEQKSQAAAGEVQRSDRVLAMVQRELSEKLTATNQVQLLAETNDRLVQHFSRAAERPGDTVALAALADALGDSTEIALARTAYPVAVELAMQTLQVRERAVAARTGGEEAEVRRLGDYRRLTQALLKAGRNSEARKQAEKTREVAGELVQRRSKDTEVIRHAGLAAFEYGDVLLAASARDLAQPQFEQGLELAHRLTALEPENPRFQQDVASGESRLADALLQKNDLPGALGHYRTSLAVLVPLSEGPTPPAGLKSQIAELHLRMGSVLMLQTKFAEAATEQQRAVEIMQTLAAAQPGNLPAQFDFAMSLRRLAESVLLSGPKNKIEALTLMQRALDHLTRHFGEKPDARITALRLEIERLRADAMK